MTKRCELTGRTIQTGNNVSHAMNKTRRRFEPNLQNATLWSETLAQGIKFRVSAYGLRTVEHNGGLDPYLLSVADSKLGDAALKAKRKIKKAQAPAAA